MVDAQILERINHPIPGVEVVRLEVDDGEEFQSKFERIAGVLCTSNEAGMGDMQITWSGSTVTLNIASASNDTCTLMVFKGN